MKLKSLCVVSVSCMFFFACGEDNSSIPQEIVSGISQGSESGNLSSGIVANSTTSSSRIAVSSSSEMSSSSSAVPGCKTETEDNCEYGTLVDSRNGRIYKTVKIGTQEWLTENVKYISRSESNLDDSTFEPVKEYDKYYTWAKALGLDEECNKNKCEIPEGKIQGVCPEGSHVPSANEFRELFRAIGCKQSYRTTTLNYKTTSTEIYYNSANKLKASSGWEGRFAGDDRYGFSALPTGRYPTYSGGIVNDAYAIYWTTSQTDSTSASEVWMYGGTTDGLATMDDESTIRSEPKKGELVVRCIKDQVLSFAK